MSDFTRTPNLNLFKPTPNADIDAWGDHLNANADTLDATLGATPGPFVPVGGGTMTGSLHVSPSMSVGQDTSSASNVNQGVSLNNAPTSLMQGGANTFQWSADTADPGTGIGSCVNVFHSVYPGVKGPRNSINAITHFVGPSATVSATQRFYCAVSGAMYAYNGDGGAVGAEKGAVFGAGFLGRASSGTYYVAVEGAEFNQGLDAGTSAKIKAGISIANDINDAVAGSTVDASIMIGNQSPNIANTYAIQLTKANGQNPVATAGNVIGSDDTATIGDILHFPTYTISGNIFKTPLATLTGSGSLTLGTIGTGGGLLSIANSGGGSLVLSGPIATNRLVTMQTGTQNRWSFGANTTGEGGANAGSDFTVISWNDAGTTPLGTPLVIARSTGVVTVGTSLQVTTGGPTWTTGSAAPAATAPVGSLYSRVGGAVGATLYVSRGAGTWAAVAGV